MSPTNNIDLIRVILILILVYLSYIDLRTFKLPDLMTCAADHCWDCSLITFPFMALLILPTPSLEHLLATVFFGS
jgi:prepilin signal peptidase PulO-like enzyme (type II secretory pathway)